MKREREERERDRRGMAPLGMPQREPPSFIVKLSAVDGLKRTTTTHTVVSVRFAVR